MATSSKSKRVVKPTRVFYKEDLDAVTAHCGNPDCPVDHSKLVVRCCRQSKYGLFYREGKIILRCSTCGAVFCEIMVESKIYTAFVA